MQLPQIASLLSTCQTAACRADEVLAVSFARTVRPGACLGRVAREGCKLVLWMQGGGVEGSQLEMRDWDAEGPQLGRERCGEGGEGSRDGGLGGVEGRVQGWDNGGCEQENFGRWWLGVWVMVMVGWRRGEERQKGLGKEDGVEKACVEEVGDVGW